MKKNDFEEIMLDVITLTVVISVSVILVRIVLDCLGIL